MSEEEVNIMLDKQNSKCLPNNICLFGQGLNIVSLQRQHHVSLYSFRLQNNLNNYVLNRQQQKKLFQISYSRQESEAKRLTNKYYKTNWSNLNSKIKQVLTDMKFRGDLRPTSSKAGQVALKKAVKANNVEQVKKVLSNKNYWKNVPKDRFERRVKFLNQNSG